MNFSAITTWETALFPRFLSDSDFKPKTQMTFRAALRAFVCRCKDNQVTAPDAASLNHWKASLLSNCQTATARTYLSAVRVFCKWFFQQGLGPDIAASVKQIKMEKVFRKDCLSAAEMKRVLTNLEHQVLDGGDKALRDFVMVLLITTCGLRVSEVSLLDVGDLDTADGKPIIWVHGKGRDGKVEFVPVPVPLRDLLYRYLAKRRNISRTSPIFVSYGHNNMGKRLSSRSISRIVKQAMVAVGLNSPRLTAHSLRHTAITLALKGGATLQQVQQFARHRLIETTLRYAHNLEAVLTPCPQLVMKLIGRLDYLGIPIG